MLSSKLREIYLSKLWNSKGEVYQTTTVNLKRKLESLLAIYEDLIGLTQVKQSHQALLEAETKFIQVQEERRKSQSALNGIQEKVRDIRFQLDRTPRGQENYLELIKKEIELVREERTLREIFEREEKNERERFTQLSTCLRASYEKERAQSEKTKPLFLLMSVFGGLIGASVSAISSQSKVKQLKQLIIETNSATSQQMTQNLEQLIRSSSSGQLEIIRHLVSSNATTSNSNTNNSSEFIVEKTDEQRHVITNVCLVAILSLLLFQIVNK